VDQGDLVGRSRDLKEVIERTLDPNLIQISYDLSLLSPVGIGMKDTPGVLAAAAHALYGENINIEIVDQGPSQLSFHFGIHQARSDDGLRALYHAMLK